MLVDGEAGAGAASVEELKAYLRITAGDEDGLLEGLLRGAAALCEQFVGQWLIVREARETVAADARWRRLTARPVVAILGVESGGAALPAEGYAIDIDQDGEGWVRAVGRPDSGLLTVRYRAGLANDMDGLPEPIRHGIVRLAADHYAARNGESASPPAIVTALWRPWRRMRIS